MGLKRSASGAGLQDAWHEGDCDAMALDDGAPLSPAAAEAAPQRRAKRAVSSARAVGVVCSDADVAAFLAGLQWAGLRCAAVIPDAAWRALAELNTLLGGCAAGIGGGALLGMHSFTRNRREDVFTAFACGQGLSEAAAAALTRGEAPPGAVPSWLLIACSVLGSLTRYPDCSMTEYTVRMPAPLVAWAARWEVATRCDQIKLLQVQAYAGGSCGCERPVRTLYLPVLSA